jgi:hypothetical protein
MLVSHWASAERFIQEANIPSWLSGEDRSRIGAYDLYEAIFWTSPEAFQITLRGQEGEPIHIPSGRQVVETAHRFMAPRLQVITDPLFGTPEARTEADLLFTEFAYRERFYSKFSSNKLHGLMRGDWLWHIWADPTRPEGSRVSIFPLDPSNYFPEYADGDDITRIIAVHIAEPTTNDNGDTVIHKTVYRKQITTGGPSPITVEEYICKADEWGQPGTDMKETVVATLAPEMTLPPEIDAIPVYHIPNVYEAQFGWGSSEMRGIELLMRSINQAITDEELALVLDGLGVWVTDAGSPVDENDEEIPWIVSPGHVVELPTGKSFKREQGVGTLQPYVDHLKYLHDQIDATTGANDITRGRADVAVAESGIALALRMGPILSRMEEKELIITDVMNQMLYDIRKWFMAYEGLPGLEDIRWRPVYGDKLPVNKKEVFDQIVALAGAGPVPLVSGAEARRMLAKLGFSFTEEGILMAEIMSEQSQYAAQQADAIASRIAGEVTGGGTEQLV